MQTPAAQNQQMMTPHQRRLAVLASHLAPGQNSSTSSSAGRCMGPLQRQHTAGTGGRIFDGQVVVITGKCVHVHTRQGRHMVRGDCCQMPALLLLFFPGP